MLRTRVKAGAITNLTDARYFAARGVEWMGFDFSTGSEDFVTPAQMLAIKEWVDGVQFVGEFNLEPAEVILSAVTELQLDAVQLGMAAAQETRQKIGAATTLIHEIIPAYYHTEEELLELVEEMRPDDGYLLVSFDKNGFKWSDLLAGSPFSLSFVESICRQYQVILGIDFPAKELGDLLTRLTVAGLHLRGGAEEKIGFKSYDDLDAIFDRLETED